MFFICAPELEVNFKGILFIVQPPKIGQVKYINKVSYLSANLLLLYWLWGKVVKTLEYS